MPQYRIYLSDDENRLLLQAAKRSNQKPQDALRSLVGRMIQDEKIDAVRATLTHILTLIEGSYVLAEITARDVAQVAGIVHASARNDETLARAAKAREASLMKQFEAVKMKVTPPKS